MTGRFAETLRENNNLFWESARNLHLDGFLESIYQSPKKRELLRRWLKNKDQKRILIRQMDFDSDPLLIELGPEHFTVRVASEREERIRAEVEITATHKAIISDSSDWFHCLAAWVRGEIKTKGLLARPRDYFYAARIFLSA